MSALHCRSYLLLQKALFKIKQNGLWGIEVNLIDDNLFLWKITLSGFKDTAWQDGKFVVVISFTENYNLDPPQVSFRTIPLHPNIDSETGAVCLGCLEQWNPDYSMSYVLLSIQNMLSDPCLKNAINKNVVDIVKKSPKYYKQIIFDCVLQSKRSRSSLSVVPTQSPIVNEEFIVGNPTMERDDLKKPTTSMNYKLSYEEYLDSWRKTGTSKTHEENKNPLVNLLSKNYTRRDYDLIKDEIDNEVYRQLSEHRMLMFGQFNKDIGTDKNRLNELKDKKVQLLKDIHANKRNLKSLTVSLPTSPTNDEDDMKNDKDDDIDPIEAKELIAWTENLPTTS